jgi:quinolinate synthase
VVLITECSMSDNVAAEYPELEFVRPCNLCPFMKKIELSNILAALENEQIEVRIDPAIAAREAEVAAQLAAMRERIALGETSVCSTCGAVYWTRDGHACG